MEDRFLQQLKKGVLEMLVLETICAGPTYGYALLTHLKEQTNGLFALKEGTLYPILYRLEDDKLIVSNWSTPEGRAAPKKCIPQQKPAIAPVGREHRFGMILQTPSAPT